MSLSYYYEFAAPANTSAELAVPAVEVDHTVLKAPSTQLRIGISEIQECESEKP